MPDPEAVHPPTAPPAPSKEAVELAPGVHIEPAGLRYQFSRSSGPGGQNVNKVNTRAELWAKLSAVTGLSERAMARLIQFAGKKVTAAGDIHIAADAHRSQEANRLAVFERLQDLISQAKHEPKTRRKTKPSRAAKQRRMDAKRRRGETKAQRKGGGDW